MESELSVLVDHMRYKYLGVAAAILLLSVPSSMAQSSGSGYFQTRGTEILDLAGQSIILRGVGLGGWLMPEGYMLHFPGYGSPTSIRRDIEVLIGAEDTETFFDRYRQYYVAGSYFFRVKMRDDEVEVLDTGSFVKLRDSASH